MLAAREVTVQETEAAIKALEERNGELEAFSAVVDRVRRRGMTVFPNKRLDKEVGTLDHTCDG